jgi:hypothetical protein
MPDWIKTLRQKIVELWIAIPIGMMGYLLSKIYADLVVLVLPEIMNKVPSILLLSLLSLSVLLNLALLFILYIKRNKYKIWKPTIQYGVYWDHMYNPLCPSCKAPLHQEEINTSTFPPPIPKLICPNGHFSKHLIENNIKLHPDKVRWDHFELNKMFIKK